MKQLIDVFIVTKICICLRLNRHLVTVLRVMNRSFINVALDLGIQIKPKPTC